jgi:hypothetical protein
LFPRELNHQRGQVIGDKDDGPAEQGTQDGNGILEEREGESATFF